jgi:hypothetical protein
MRSQRAAGYLSYTVDCGYHRFSWSPLLGKQACAISNCVLDFASCCGVHLRADSERSIAHVPCSQGLSTIFVRVTDLDRSTISPFSRTCCTRNMGSFYPRGRAGATVTNQNDWCGVFNITTLSQFADLGGGVFGAFVDLVERFHARLMSALDPSCDGVALALFQFRGEQRFQMTQLSQPLLDGLFDLARGMQMHAGYSGNRSSDRDCSSNRHRSGFRQRKRFAAWTS